MFEFRNSLKYRLGIYIITAATLPILILFISLNLSIKGQILSLEENDLKQDTQIIEKYLELSKSSLLKLTTDYSIWDDMYQQIQTRDPLWFRDYLTGYLPIQFNVDLVALIDQNGNLVTSNLHIKDFNTSNLRNIPYLKEAFYDKSGTLIVNIEGIPYLIAYAPVHKTNYLGEQRGVLVIGKTLANILYSIPEENQFIMLMRYADNNNPYSFEKTSNTIYYTYPIKDYSGKDTAFLLLGKERNIFDAYKKINEILLKIFLITLILLFLLVVTVNNIFVSRINNLTKIINFIKVTKKPVEIQTRQRDEIDYLISSFNEMVEELNRLAITDPISNTFNYRYFREFLKEKLEECKNLGKKLILVFIEIAHFNLYREIHGHMTADDLVEEFSKIIMENLPKEIYFFRISEAKFALISLNSHEEQICEELQKLRRLIEKHPFHGREVLPADEVSFYAGVVCYPDAGDTMDQLINHCDIELAKNINFKQVKISRYFSIFNNLKDDVADNKQLMVSVNTILSIMNAMDEYTFVHTEGVLKYAMMLGNRLNLSKKQMFELKISALLHDIGKIAVGSELLNKQGKLSEEEIELIRKHPEYGAKMLHPLKRFNSIIPYIRHHHERYDGKGYPSGLSGNEIPLISRIIAIADSFDAMTTRRAYRKTPLNIEEATEELRKEKGKQFDPELVEVFITLLKE